MLMPSVEGKIYLEEEYNQAGFDMNQVSEEMLCTVLYLVSNPQDHPKDVSADFCLCYKAN